MANDTMDILWNELLEAIGNPLGVAALMGNLQAESSLNPKCITNCPKGMTKDLYFSKLADGSYPKKQFARDGAAFGLAQWCYFSRKEMLYDFIKDPKQIAELKPQIRFLVCELSNYYKKVWNTLKETDSIREASDIVLDRYEKPANRSESVRVKRCKIGEDIYLKYTSIQKKEGTTDMEPILKKRTDTTTATAATTVQQPATVTDIPKAEPEPVKEPIVETTADSVLMRSGNGKEYDTIDLIDKKGSKFKWIATAENGWHAVVVRGKSSRPRVVWVSGEFSRKTEGSLE